MKARKAKKARKKLREFASGCEEVAKSMDNLGDAFEKAFCKELNSAIAGFLKAMEGFKEHECFPELEANRAHRQED